MLCAIDWLGKKFRECPKRAWGKSFPALYRLGVGQVEGGKLKEHSDTKRGAEGLCLECLQYDIKPLCCVAGFTLPLYIVNLKTVADGILCPLRRMEKTEIPQLMCRIAVLCRNSKVTGLLKERASSLMPY